MDEQLAAYARSAFGLDGAGAVTVAAGARGALGQIWRFEVGTARYALKEIFPDDGPVPPALVEAELDFSRLAAASGVRLPASHADRDGRYLVPLPSGAGWLRLYDWVDLRPVTMPAAAGDLGVLLARLHRCAPAVVHEPGGGRPDPWYDRTPPMPSWAPLVAAAREVGVWWAPRLSDVVAALPALCALVTPADPAAMVVCHRDLHPENVWVDASGGELVVVDWDNLGPAEPARELARVLFDWFVEGDDADLDAIRRTYEAYLRAGGPGRIGQLPDFSMLVACRLNFLRVQVGAAVDPRTEQRHRDWAEREIEEALRILPTPRLLAEVLDTVRLL